MEFNLVDHLIRQKEFFEKTFGPGERTAGVIDHIRKELVEIEEHPDDISEWVDVIILAFDGAWIAGWHAEDIVEAIVAKQTKNENREWPDWRTADPNKAIEHVRVPSSPNAYWDLWDNYNQMEDSFTGSTYSNWNIESDEDVVKLSMIPDKVLAAAYHYEDYEGHAFVLFIKDGMLFEVNGSHCSCYELEGQWEPELVDIESLEHRLLESLKEPEWGFVRYHGEDFTKHVLRELQEFARR